MYTEIFEIEFQVPDVEEKYITFELEVTGCWKMQEIGGGDMGMCLDWDSNILELPDTDEDYNYISHWIATNHEAIRKMFAERIKKYED
jgi:hypothetical protein